MSQRRGRWWGLALAVALLVTACLPEGMRVPQSEFLAAVERKSGLIAYLGTDGNIYVIDQGGGESTALTDDARIADDYLIYGAPVWSPDNQSVAFARFTGQGTGAPEHTGLFVAQRDGTKLVEAFSSRDYLVYYYWSPDSRHVSFLASTPGQNLALRIVSPSGGDAEILDVGAPYYWTWAPDSHSLLIHAGGATADTQPHLSVLHVDGPVIERGLDIIPSSFKAPAYSPDGSRMLVAGQIGEGKSALLLADAHGNQVEPLAEYSGNIAFAWSPDGQHVAYIKSEDDPLGLEGTLTVVDPNGRRKPVELKDQLAAAFFWSPDSKSLAYFTMQTVAAPTPEAGGQSTAEEFTVWNLNIMEARSGKTRSVATFLPSDRFLQVIPFFDQYHKSATIWSPDSKNLVVSAYGGGDTPGIFVVAASGKLEPRFIAPGLVGFWSWK